MAILVFAVAGSAQAASLTTDLVDYPPGSIVTLYGSGFQADETVTVQVVHADGTPPNGEGHELWNVTASSSGDFVAYWLIPYDDNLGETLLATAEGLTSGLLGSVTFTDNIGTNLDQLQNGTVSSTPEWANGNINGSNSCYSEGDVVPYRFFLTGVPGGTSHTFTISFEATKGGVHALDYLSQFDLTESAELASIGGACSNTSTSAEPGCTNPAVVSVATLPDPTNYLNYDYVSGDPPTNVKAILSSISPAFLIDGPGDFYGYNATGVIFSTYYYTGTTSDRELNIDVTFTAIVNGDVGFFWGGHLARGITDGWGFGNGAASVGGAPYHMRAGNLDGGGGAYQDRSIQNGVICLPPDATITCVATSEHCEGGSYSCSIPNATGTFVWTATGATITSGQGTTNITYTITAGLGETVTISVEACDDNGGCPGDFCCNNDSIEFIVDQCCEFSITCPANTTIECDASTDPSNTGTATYTSTGTGCPSVSLTYSDSEVGGACDQEKVITRTWQLVDGSSTVLAECEQTITVEDNTAPVCTVPANSTIFQCVPTQVCLPVGCTDNCDPNPTISILSGPGAIVNGEWCYTPSTNETASVTVKCLDACDNFCESTFNITFELNSSPVCQAPSNQTIFQCEPTEVCLPVGCTDVDGNLLGSQPTIISGPGTIVNGEWCYTPAGDETANVTIQCEDECGATSTCSFAITFEANAPTFCTVPDNQLIFQCTPAEVCLPVGCSDTDGNLLANQPTIISGPGAIVNGDWCYTPAGDETANVTIQCEDACGATSQCSFAITFDINEAPVCSVPDNQTIFQCEPTEVCLPVGCTDADGNLVAGTLTLKFGPDEIVSGPGTIVNEEWCYTPSGSETVTVTLRCEDECGAFSECTFSITFEINSAPICTVPENQTFFQCEATAVCLPVGCTDVDGNLLSSQPTIISGPGTIVNGEWCYTPTGDEIATVTIQCEDECGATCRSTFVITFEINEAPVCSVPDNQIFNQCIPEEVCLPVGCTDADGNLLANQPTILSGPGAIVNGEWCYTPQGNETAVVTIQCEDECGATSECTFSIEFVVNSAPVIVDCPGDINVHWGTFISETITATDIDGTVTFSLGDGSPGSISATGVFTWNTSGSSVCGGDVTVIVTDDCDIADSCTFNICVYNDPPTLACTDPGQVCWGSTLTGQVIGSDPDGGPINLFYTVTSFDGPGTVTIDGATGEYTWVTSQSAEFAGTFELCIEVTDNANTCEPCSPTNSASCCILLTVVPAYQVHIEKTHGTLQGHYVDVAVYLDSSIVYTEMGGFNFLIGYDASALTFSGAVQGQFLTDCGWEYFTYRYGAFGNCGSGCPSGEIRIVGIAEINNGDNHPICRTNDGVSSVLANLTFLVTNDRTLECNYVPIRFHWYECSDNTISSPGGDTLYLASAVYDYRPIDGQGEYQEITNTTAMFPSYTGAHFSCDDGSDESAKTEPLRCLEFYNGGVDIVCADSIDARGDINLDGLAYTISDAVMYINYFIEGLSAFTNVTDTNSYGFAPGYEGSVAASDVNADGLTLTVSDMVYLIRVIVGDALPYPKVTPLLVSMTNDNGVLSVDHEMGAAYILVRGLETPTLLAGNLDMKYRHEDGNTRIIIYSLESESFSGEFVALSGELIGLELATYEGQPAITKLVPSEFKLDQNYPNPFNPTTMISFQLPSASKTRLDIYNVQGQRVATLVDSYLEAGTHQFLWESIGASSGIYFYRLETETVTETRKMILLK